MTTNGHEPDTELTPTAQAPEVPEAWSVDEADEHSADNEQRPRRHGPIVSLGLVALVVGIIGCVILLGAAFFNWHTSKHAEPSHVPSPAPTTPVAAPPTTPVVTPPPPPPTPAPMFSAALDQQLLTTLKGKFYTILNSEWAIQNAHRFCELIQEQGVPAAQARQMVAQEALAAHPVGPEVGIESTYPLFTGNAWDAVQLDWDMLTSSAMTVYPHCGTR
ncbi:MAG: hypothetical protein ACLQLO_29160 [Mycobacterium sp.]